MYIGNCALILPRVTIEENVIVGAGAVVTKSIPANCIVAGNQAKIIGKIDDLLRNSLAYNLNIKNLVYKAKKNYLSNINNRLLIKKHYLEE